MLIVGVDSGRKGIKFYSYDSGKITKKIFDSKYTYVNFNKLKYHPILNFKKDDDIIASIDNDDPTGYGEICLKIAPPSEIQYVSDDNIYIEKSINYTLVAIAKMVTEKNQDVMIGFDLTEENIDQDEIIIEKLKGKHTVVFYDTLGNEIGNKTFNVKKTGVWYQCWIGFMSIAINDDFTINEELAGKEILCIDIGKKTAIGHYINMLSPVDHAASNEAGAGKFFEYLQEEIKIEFGISKTIHELENMILNNKSFFKSGKKIDIKKSYINALKRYEDILRNFIKDKFFKYEPEKIIFIGGGALLFGDMLKQMYENAEILDDPVFRNAWGLIKLVVRKFIKNIKGM